MLNRAPFIDSWPDPEQKPDESKPAELLAGRPKAAFQWPPECVWPFIDRKLDGDA